LEYYTFRHFYKHFYQQYIKIIIAQLCRTVSICLNSRTEPRIPCWWFLLLMLWPHSYKQNADLDTDIPHNRLCNVFHKCFVHIACCNYAYMLPHISISKSCNWKHSCISHSLSTHHWQIPQNYSPVRITRAFRGQIQIQIHKCKYIYPYTVNSFGVLHPYASSILMHVFSKKFMSGQWYPDRGW